MKRFVVAALAISWASAAFADNQFRIEYKIYRTTVPDKERAAKEQTVRSSPIIGIIEGDYINEDAGFFEDDGQLVFRPGDSDEERRYGLVSAPQLVIGEDREATIQIGEQIPYQGVEDDEDGKPVSVTKHKNVGTTVNVVISESGDDKVFIRTDGKFVTLVGRQKMAVVDQDGNASVLPILETTSWKSETAVPLGGWLYQRVKVTQGHEFLIFARVTRFDADAEDKHAQYSVELKLLRIPPEHAKKMRKAFVYEDDQKPTGDDARIFRVTDSSTVEDAPTLMKSRVFLAALSRQDVELLSAPRVTLGYGPYLKILVSNTGRNRPAIKNRPDGRNGITNIVDYIKKRNPALVDFLGTRAPYQGVILDMIRYWDAESGTEAGFEGYLFGVQIDPPSSDSDELLGLDLFYHNQFKTGGRERGRIRKATPYTFDNQAFRFSDLTVRVGDSLGIEFMSKQTGDLNLLLVEVSEVGKSRARFTEPDTAQKDGQPDARGHYEVSSRILRIPRKYVSAVRDSLIVVDDVKVPGGDAIPFRNDGSLAEFAASLAAQYEAELIFVSDAKIPYPNLFYLRTTSSDDTPGVFLSPERKVTTGSFGGSGGVSGLGHFETKPANGPDGTEPQSVFSEKLVSASPLLRDYFALGGLDQSKRPLIVGMLMDFDGHWSDVDMMLRFDGNILGVQIDPRDGTDQFRLSGDLERRYGRERPQAQSSAKGESVDLERISFADAWLHDGEWVGVAFDDSQTDDLLLWLTSATKSPPAEDIPKASPPEDENGVDLRPYSVNTRVMKIPKENAESVRALFTYVEGLVPAVGTARAFRVHTPQHDSSEPVLMTLDRFNFELEQLGAELETAPRLVLQNRIRSERSDAAQKSSVHDVFLAKSPGVKEYLQSAGPYRGYIADILTQAIPASETDPSPSNRFLGYLVGLRIDPPEDRNGSILALDIFYHSAFETTEKLDKRDRKKKGTRMFGDDIFDFQDVRMRVGSWIGFEYDSTQSGDLMVVTVNVTNVDTEI